MDGSRLLSSKSDNIQKYTITNRKEEPILRHLPSPLTVKSFQNKEVMKFSTGQLYVTKITKSHTKDISSSSLEIERLKERFKTEAESNLNARSVIDKEKKKTSWLSVELRRKNCDLKEISVYY